MLFVEEYINSAHANAGAAGLPFLLPLVLPLLLVLAIACSELALGDSPRSLLRRWFLGTPPATNVYEPLRG